ncbi:hypothetical protein AAMO2058_001757300 [Amorphochlora amoebiformis]
MPKIIYLRRNIVDTIVANEVTATSGIYEAKNDRMRTKVIKSMERFHLDTATVSKRIRKLAIQRAHITKKLQALHASVLVVNFAACVRRPQECLGSVETFLGVDTKAGYGNVEYNGPEMIVKDTLDSIISTKPRPDYDGECILSDEISCTAHNDDIMGIQEVLNQLYFLDIAKYAFSPPQGIGAILHTASARIDVLPRLLRCSPVGKSVVIGGLSALWGCLNLLKKGYSKSEGNIKLAIDVEIYENQQVRFL